MNAEPQRRVGAAEWRWVGGYAVVLTLITLVPYVVGWYQGGDAWLFNGFTFGVQDGNAYLGKMRLGYEGGWEFYLFYTPEETASEFGLYLPHLLIGHAIRLLSGGALEGASLVRALVVGFHLWRSVASMVLIAATYRFIAVFLASVSARRLALVIATLGGGLGWLLVMLGQTQFLGTLPLDFLVPESYTFLVLYGLPHIATARAAFLLGFVALFHALRAQARPTMLRGIVVTALLWHIVGLMVTFYLAVIYCLLAAWGLVLWWRSRQLPWEFAWRAGSAAALTLPLFAYFAYLFLANDAYEQWSAQNFLPSPHPAHYVLGYIVLASVALWGIVWAWRRATDPPYALLVGWVIAVPVLVYLPLNVQRRLAEAVLVPLAILAVVGLRLLSTYVMTWLGRSASVRFRRSRAVLLGLLLPSSLILWLSTLLGLLNPTCLPDFCAYRPQTELEALHWLDENAQPQSVVLGAVTTGNYLPVHTHLRPVLGHGPETIGFDDKQTAMQRFYEGRMSAEERAAFLARYDIRYVFWGPLERTIADDASLWNDGLMHIYAQEPYHIYMVIHE